MKIRIENISNISELFDAIFGGISIVHNRIDVWNIDGVDTERLSKIWQIEKVSEHEYCYKTFDGYGKGIKHLFFLDNKKTEKPISEYYDNYRLALCNIMSSVYGDEELVKELVSSELFNYGDYLLNYTNRELLEDKQFKRMYKYRFTSFKTRQTAGSNKSGEEEIRVVLNKHIEEKYPKGIRHDEYMTQNSNSRADSVVFNRDSIHVYEIKSKKDSFTRLERQIEDYRKYADRITLVLDIKKMSAFIKNHAHKYSDVEVLVFYGADTNFEVASRGKKLNPTTNKTGLLWKAELREVMLSGILKISNFSQTKLALVASAVFTKKQALEIANEILYTRHKTVGSDGRMQRGKASMNFIFDKYKLRSSALQAKADITVKKQVER